MNNNEDKLISTTKDAAAFSSDFGLEWLVNSGKDSKIGPKRIVWAAKAYGALKNVGLGFIFDKAIKKESSRQAALSNFAGLGAAEAVGTVAASALAATTLPETAAIGGTIVAGSLAYGIADSYVDNHYSKFQSLFNKAKLYVQKKQKADITVPTEKELLNVSNSAAVQKTLNQNNAIQVIEHIPTPVIQSSGSNFLSTLTSILGIVSGVAGIASGALATPKVTKEVSAQIVGRHHTGGKVPGRGDILALLKGGETVRTEAQEKELQEQMLKKHFESFAPLVSGQGDDEQNQQNGAFSSYSEKKSVKPILQDRTRHDEEMIIGIIADAWKTNRSGFRRILKSC